MRQLGQKNSGPSRLARIGAAHTAPLTPPPLAGRRRLAIREWSDDENSPYEPRFDSEEFSLENTHAAWMIKRAPNTL